METSRKELQEQIYIKKEKNLKVGHKFQIKDANEYTYLKFKNLLQRG